MQTSCGGRDAITARSLICLVRCQAVTTRCRLRKLHATVGVSDMQRSSAGRRLGRTTIIGFVRLFADGPFETAEKLNG